MNSHEQTGSALQNLQQKLESSPSPDDVRLTVSEAEVYIPMSRNQLAQLRYTGKGPKFLKPTSRIVLYRKCDIDEWLNKSEHTSTAED